MLLNLTDLSSESLTEQISWQLIEKVLDGELNSGDELTSIGSMARKQHINKNTIRRAYEELESMNIIEFRNEFGYFIKEISTEFRQELLQKYSLRRKAIKKSDLISTDEYLKLERELLVARQIQSELLPEKYLNDANFEISTFIEPSRIVCGDFYDYFKISEDKIGLVIADACGKGIPAALLISQIQAILKCDISNGPDCCKILNKLNHYLVNNTSSKNFTTLLYGLYNLNTDEFEYSNAGHNLPIVVRSNGTFELLKTSGPALGLLKNFKYSSSKIFLGSNDLICFYTDGITETMDKHGEQFGEGRLIELLISSKSFELRELVDKVTAEINSFNSPKYLSDDKTIMMLKNKIVK
jgi:serine phosphatase RsbU (regulator of sigma subunit)